MSIFGKRIFRKRETEEDPFEQTRMEDFGEGGKYERKEEEKRCQ